jgi:hypothetical protein
MIRRGITIATGILFVAGVLCLLAGWRMHNPLLNDAALTCMMVGWVLARWRVEHTNPLYKDKNPLTVMLLLSPPALVGLFVGVFLFRPAPEYMRVVIGLSGFVGWVVLRTYFALSNARQNPN